MGRQSQRSQFSTFLLATMLLGAVINGLLLVSMAGVSGQSTGHIEAASVCEYGSWSEAWGPCVRENPNEWIQNRTRTAAEGFDNDKCLPQIETRTCSPPVGSRPANGPTAIHGAVLAFLTALPLAINASLAVADPALAIAVPAAYSGLDITGPQSIITIKEAMNLSPAASLVVTPYTGPLSDLITLAATVPTATRAAAFVSSPSGEVVENGTTRTLSQIDGFCNASSLGEAGASCTVPPFVVGRIMYDGHQKYNITFNFDAGNKSVTLGQSALNSFVDTVYGLQPWLTPEVGLAAFPQNLMDMRFEYDITSQAITLSANTNGNYLYLIDSLKDRLATKFGVRIPATISPYTDAATAAARVVLSSTGSIEVVSMALNGQWTPKSLASRLGFYWPIQEDVLKISGLQLEYSTQEPSFVVHFLASIPPLGIERTSATLRITSYESLTLTVSGHFSPIPWLDGISNASFQISREGGLQASTTGIIAGISVEVALSYVKKTTTAVMTATNVKIGELISNVLTNEIKVPFPQPIIDLASGLDYKELSVRYVNDFTTDKIVSLSATPDIQSNALLNAVLKFTTASPDDFLLTIDSVSGPTLAVTKNVTIPLPKPFVGDGTLRVSSKASVEGISFFGEFGSALNIPGIKQNPVSLSLGAGIGVGALGPEATLAGAVLSPVSIQKFPSFTLDNLNVSATFSPEEPFPTALFLQGALHIAGAQADALVMYSTGEFNKMGLKANYPRLSLGAVLESTGVNVDLGSFGFDLEKLAVNFATESIPEYELKRGMLFDTDVRMLGMVTKSKIELTPRGLKNLTLLFDASEASKAFNGIVLKELDDGLHAFGNSLESAGSGLVSDRDAAKKALLQAQNDVDEKKKDLIGVQAKFDEAHAAAQEALDRAKQGAAKASQDLADYRAQVQADLDKAKAKVDRAADDFEAAKRDAHEKLRKAQEDVDEAQRKYDQAMAGPLRALHAAEENVRRIQNDYNHHNQKCGKKCCSPGVFGRRICVSCHPDSCAEVGRLWTEQQAALGALKAAEAIVNDVAGGVVGAALKAYKGSLSAARGTYDDVLKGGKAVALEGARTALEASQVLFDRIETSAQFGANLGAQGALRAAQATYDGVLKGSEWTALEAANAGLAVAELALKGAEVAANETLEALSVALREAGGALGDVRTAGFLDIGSIKVEGELSLDKVHLSATLSFKVKGRPLSPSISLNLPDSSFSPGLLNPNPLALLKEAYKSGALDVLKSIYPTLKRLVNL